MISYSSINGAISHQDCHLNSHLKSYALVDKDLSLNSARISFSKMAGNDGGSKNLHNIPRTDGGKIEKESELIGMLSKQLYLAGNQMQRMQAVLKKAEDRLKSKDQEIGRLKRKVRVWEVKSRNQEIMHKKELKKQQSQVDNADYNYKKCKKLEHKIFEMEKFLADYGLVWVGDKVRKDTSTVKKSESINNDSMKMCYSQLMLNIEELNLSVGKGEMHVCHNQSGAVFKSPSCMTLKFYKNGMIVKKGRLRSYKDPHTKSFIQDILDGYFPSELQQDYPNGVPFKVEDHRMESYVGEGANYPGTGYQLGKQSLNQIRPSNSSGKVKNFPKVRSSPDNIQNWNISKLSSSPRPSPFTIRSNSIEHSADLPKASSGARLPDLDIYDLRSQILASHNNNCSDSHLQSHINAVLSLSGRNEKRSGNVSQSSDYHSPTREQFISSTEKIVNGSTNQKKTTRRYSIDRSTFSMPVSRQNESSNSRLRSRSASLTGNRQQLKSSPRFNNNDNNNMNPKFNIINDKIGKLRSTKSVTLNENKHEIPILREINSSTGEAGELRLKVRSMNGSTVYLVHITADDSVERLYQLLDTVVRPKRRSTVGYKILISGYSPRKLDHLECSLRDYGILYDCVLHLVND